MTSDRIPISPDVLRWARLSAGFDERAAAKKLGVSDSTLQRWEDGSKAPTVKQLRTAAKHYKRPLAVLLLPSPPLDFSPMRDFRRTGNEGHAEWSPALRAEFKRSALQRDVYLELLDLAPAAIPFPSAPFDLSGESDAETVAETLRVLLGFDDRPPAWGRPNEALNSAVAAVERLGILVIHTRGVETSEMRGFSVSTWPYPLIALNGTDWPRARLFTLAHELAHIALNDGGLCDLHEDHGTIPSTDDAIEHFCNRVAAAIFMPRQPFLDSAVVRAASETHAWSVEDLRLLSLQFGPSSEAVLLRLVSLGRSSWPEYWRIKAELDDLYESARAEEKAKQKASDGGPSYYTVKARNLGHGYISTVLDAYRSRSISSLDVADYLDVRYDQIPKLEQVLR